MNFEAMLRLAGAGDQRATVTLLELYKPLLGRASIVNCKYDEDLYQELCMTFLRCVRLFRIP